MDYQLFLEQKIDDYRRTAITIPSPSKLLSNGFARTMGLTAGKMLLGYDALFTGLEGNEPTEDAIRAAKKVTEQESKVKMKLPLLGEKRGRLCGLVALNHAGFWESEGNFYAALGKDLSQTETDVMFEALYRLGVQQQAKYSALLVNKAQSIQDFSVLMGIAQDGVRFKELTEDMHKDMKDYFTKVRAAHKGKLGISWPIPFQSYQNNIVTGLYFDSVAHDVQKGLQESYGFKQAPKQSHLQELIGGVKDSTTLSASKELGFWQRTKLARALPASLFFLSGVNVYAQDLGGEVVDSQDYITAATTAALGAWTTADGEDGVDPGDFLTTFLTFFTTTAP